MRCVALAASIAFAPAARADEEEVVLLELEQNGHVVRDGKGILHVFASTEHDLVLLQGWCHATDRLWQMDYYRRVASGTVAELVGASGLPGDVRVFACDGSARAAGWSYNAADSTIRNNQFPKGCLSASQVGGRTDFMRECPVGTNKWAPETEQSAIFDRE